MREDQVARQLSRDVERVTSVFQAEREPASYWSVVLRRAALELEEADGIRRTDLGLPTVDGVPPRWLGAHDRLLGDGD